MTGEAMTPPPIAFPQSRTCPYHPPAAYAPLREDRPLSKVTLYDGRSVWIVTGFTQARELLTDPRLSADRDNEAFPSPTERFARVRRRRLSLLGVDDPEHHTQRRMVIPNFTVKRINAMRPRIQQIVDDLLDTILTQGPPAELVKSFALPVSSQVMCTLLGVPYTDHEFFEEQARKLLAGPGIEDTRHAGEQLDTYLTTLITHKQHHPGDGLLDELIHTQYTQGTLTREDLTHLAALLLVAGHETTANMISLGTFTLLQHPDHLTELHNNPTLMPAAVEELLRFCSIAEGGMRVATQDIPTPTTTIKKNDAVVFSATILNRDPTIYTTPDQLNWHRPDRHHLAFGFGIHQCLGQNLARTEIDIALTTLIHKIPTLHLAQPPHTIPFKPGDTLQGMITLPVNW